MIPNSLPREKPQCIGKLIKRRRRLCGVCLGFGLMLTALVLDRVRSGLLGLIKIETRLQVSFREIENSDFHRTDTAARIRSLASLQSENVALPSAWSRSAS